MKVARQPLAEQWADRICSQLGKSVEAIIEVGRLLAKAKGDLAHGEWGRLFGDGLVPFSQGTAGRLIAIAAHPVLSDSAHAPNLPQSWMSLYELTKVPEPTLKNAISDGVITPDMPRKAVADLIPPKPDRPVRPVPVVEPLTKWADDEAAARIDAALRPARDLVDDWPDGEGLDLFIHEVRQLLKYLETIEIKRHVEKVSA